MVSSGIGGYHIATIYEVGSKKKIPNHKYQITKNKTQISNHKNQVIRQDWKIEIYLDLGICSLRFIWILEFGSWNLDLEISCSVLYLILETSFFLP
jgi:hypothetical protein